MSLYAVITHTQLPSIPPYTTHFRSADDLDELHHRHGVHEVHADDAVRAARSGREAGDGDRAGIGGEDGRDRKRTRLYSSHLVISYSVYCLEKKIICRCTTCVR